MLSGPLITVICKCEETACDGMGRRAEGARQYAQRVFRSLDSLAELARFDLGIGRLGVDLADLQRRG